MKSLIALVSWLIAFQASAAVWNTTQQWSADYEKKYQNWLFTNTSETMFSAKTLANGKPNPYYGIRVDCADTVYSLRSIFAFENGLPFVINNPAGSDLSLITNQLTRFDSTTDSVQRFKKFLVWMYDIVSTKTMHLDTYSIPYKSIRPGSIILVSRTNHHSWTIKHIDAVGNPILIFNSIAGASAGYEIQERRTWPTPSWVFDPEVVRQNPNDPNSAIISTKPVYVAGSYAGFRAWKPNDMMKTPQSAIPGFSNEQFTVGLNKWITTAQKVLASKKETLNDAVMRMLSDACADYQQRVLAVKDAEIFKTQKGNKCMNADDFDTYSTPSRDRRLVEAIIKARTYFKYGVEKNGMAAFSNNLAIYQSLFPYIELSAKEESVKETAKNTSNYCVKQINATVGSLSLGEIKRLAARGILSSNPNDSINARFGLPRTSKDLGPSCANFGLTNSNFDLALIEKEALTEVSLIDTSNP